MKWHIPLIAIAIGFAGLTASCIYMENPWGIDELYYGYPFLWLNTSKSLLISFPPIPLRVNVLWVGFLLDMLLYSFGGFVVSYLVFTLRENMKLLRFFIKSGIVFFVGAFMGVFILYALSVRGPTPVQESPSLQSLVNWLSSSQLSQHQHLQSFTGFTGCTRRGRLRKFLNRIVHANFIFYGVLNLSKVWRARAAFINWCVYALNN